MNESNVIKRYAGKTGAAASGQQLLEDARLRDAAFDTSSRQLAGCMASFDRADGPRVHPACSKVSGVDTPPTLLFFPKDSSAQCIEPNEPLNDSEKQERIQGNERKEIARRIKA
jgi:hypothetical protein